MCVKAIACTYESCEKLPKILTCETEAGFSLKLKHWVFFHGRSLDLEDLIIYFTVKSNQFFYDYSNDSQIKVKPCEHYISMWELFY